MIENFSNNEIDIIDFFDGRKAMGLEVPRQAGELQASSRLEALLSCLESADLKRWSKHAIVSASAIRDMLELRNMLAHARVRINTKSVRFDWFANDKGSLTKRQKQMSPSEMLENLILIEKLTKNLSSELGQVARRSKMDRPAP